MVHRTTPSLSDAERMRRYRANHPERREKHRLYMKGLRALARQKRDAQRLGLITPTDESDDPEVLAAIARLVKPRKIVTGLAQEENPIKAGCAAQAAQIQGSKV